jgi:hypothetical protein
VKLPSPHGFPVKGRPNSDLLRELQWYLETFLDYPFPPEIDHADRVLKALKDWGEQTFAALFDNRSGGRMFEAATSGDYSGLHLQISSDDARVLSWPWEALRDPEAGFLAQTCQIRAALEQDSRSAAVAGIAPQRPGQHPAGGRAPVWRAGRRVPFHCPAVGRAHRKGKAPSLRRIAPSAHV